MHVRNQNMEIFREVFPLKSAFDLKKKNLLAIFKWNTSEKYFPLPASDQNPLFCEMHCAFRCWCGLGFRHLVHRCHS